MQNLTKLKNKITTDNLLLILITLLIVPVLSWNLNQHVGLRVFADEMGPLAAAAFLYGYDWSGIMSTVAYYSYGYALILYPLFFLFDDPILILRAAILINCILLSLVFPMAYSIAKSKAPNANKWLLMAISLVAVLFFANVAMARFIWSEAMLIFVFWLLCFLIFKANKKSNIIIFILIGFFLIYIYMLHQRALSVTLAGFFTVFYLRFCDKISTKQLLVIFGISAAMLILHNSLLRPQVLQNIWLRNADSTISSPFLNPNQVLANDYAAIMNKVRNISSLENIRKLLEVTAGQFFSLGTSTLLLAYVGILSMSRDIIITLTNTLKRNFVENEESGRHALEIFILLTFFISFAVSVLFLSRPSVFNHIFYERYLYHVMGPLVFMALINMFCLQRADLKILSLSFLCYLLLFPLLPTLLNIFPDPGFFWHSIAGLTFFLNAGVFFVFNAYLSIAVTIFLFIAAKLRATIKMISILLLAITFLLMGTNIVHNYLLPNVNISGPFHSEAAKILQAVSNNRPLFATMDVSPISIQHFQFFLMDRPITRIMIYDFKLERNDLLLTSNPYLFANEFIEVYNITPDIFMMELSEPRYDYTFTYDDTFSHQGFSYYKSESRWMENGYSSLRLNLDKQDYIIEIKQHHHIPEQILNSHFLKFNFYFNNNLIAIFSNADIIDVETLRISLPKDYVIDGINILEIIYDTWTPVEIGSADSRQLGLSIHSIIMVPTHNNDIE